MDYGNRLTDYNYLRYVGWGEQNPCAREFFSEHTVNLISKKVSEVNDSASLPSIFIKSVNEAYEGRPGPVIIDIPDNIQREYLTIEKLDKTEYLKFENSVSLVHGTFGSGKSFLSAVMIQFYHRARVLGLVPESFRILVSSNTNGK